MMVSHAVRRGSRALLAAGIVALVASLPIGARASGPLAVVNTTVDSGWSNGTIGALYNHAIEPTTGGSNAVLKDKDNATVAGTVVVKASVTEEIPDSIVFASTDPLEEGKAPYTVTFTAVGQVSGEQVVTQKTFSVDLIQPQRPVIEGASMTPRVVMPDETLTLAGAASDAKRLTDQTGAYRSGVAVVELQFYRVEGPGIPPDPNAVSRFKLKLNATLSDCTASSLSCTDAGGTVVMEKAWTLTPRLDPGLWTAKVYAIDKAGNRSNSAEMTFLKLG